MVKMSFNSTAELLSTEHFISSSTTHGFLLQIRGS